MKTTTAIGPKSPNLKAQAKRHRSRVRPDIAEALRLSLKPVFVLRDKGTRRDAEEGVYTNGSDFFFAQLDDGIPVGHIKPLTIQKAIRYTRLVGIESMIKRKPVDLHTDRHEKLMLEASLLIERLEEKVGAR